MVNVNFAVMPKVYLNIGQMSRVFANGPGDRVSIPSRVIANTQKMVHDAAMLSTQHCKVRIKGKVEQSWEWSSALSYASVSYLFKKGALGWRKLPILLISESNRKLHKNITIYNCFFFLTTIEEKRFILFYHTRCETTCDALSSSAIGQGWCHSFGGSTTLAAKTVASTLANG